MPAELYVSCVGNIVFHGSCFFVGVIGSYWELLGVIGELLGVIGSYCGSYWELLGSYWELTDKCIFNHCNIPPANLR